MTHCSQALPHFQPLRNSHPPLGLSPLLGGEARTRDATERASMSNLSRRGKGLTCTSALAGRMTWLRSCNIGAYPAPGRLPPPRTANQEVLGPTKRQLGLLRLRSTRPTCKPPTSKVRTRRSSIPATAGLRMMMVLIRR